MEITDKKVYSSFMEKEKISEKTGKQVFKSGVVALIGPPNAGKSTLLNRLSGQKIAIVTPKPQTTRNRILAVINGDNYQIMLLDTPGLHKARDIMNREMVKVAMASLAEADLVLFLVDGASFTLKELAKRKLEYQQYLTSVKVPVLLALNKVDLLQPDQLLPILAWYDQLYPFTAMVPISALDGDGVDTFLAEIATRLPEGPQYYPDDIPTDASERFIVAELIREKIFILTREEVPYSTAVMIESFKRNDSGKSVLIHATILVERGSQKGIIIGQQGKMIARIREEAVREIVELLGCRVNLKLWIKIKKKWTTNENILRELGLQGSGNRIKVTEGSP